MRYSTGMQKYRVKVAKRAATQDSTFGGTTSVTSYEWLRQAGDHAFWMAEDFNRGLKAMREGALDAYDTVMFRCDYHEGLDRWCLLQYQGRWYQITSFHADYSNNTTQITAVELANQNVDIAEPLLDADSLVLMDADGIYLTAD